MKDLTLVQGQYTPHEAREMLLGMLDIKINFHKLKNLSSEVCQYKPDEEAWNTINSLCQAKEELLQLIEQAARNNSSIRIESSVKVLVEEPAQPSQMLMSA